MRCFRLSIRFKPGIVPLFRSFLCITLAVVCLAGCGNSEERIKVYPVRGAVLVGGKPASGVQLQFHPEDSSANIFPRATTNESGTFRLGTYESQDGIPAGEYLVTASWKQTDAASGEDIEMHPDEMSNVEEKLDLIVTDPATTPLKVTINESENQLEPFVVAPSANKTAKQKRQRK